MSHHRKTTAAGVALGLLFLIALIMVASSDSLAATPQQPAAGKKKGPQVKSKEEYDAFLAAVNAPEAATAESAAREFEAKYPKSELLATLYEQVMAKYQKAGNADKTLEMGRTALKYNPNSPIALVMVANLVAEQARETDIDLDQKLKEVSNDANRALQAVESGNFYLGAAATPDQVQTFKSTVTFMANSALGLAELTRGDGSAAEQQFAKAVNSPNGAQDATTWLRLAQAQERQKKYSEALKSAGKAAQFAQPGSEVANKAAAAQDRLKQEAGTPAAPAPSSTEPKPESVPVK